MKHLKGLITMLLVLATFQFSGCHRYPVETLENLRVKYPSITDISAMEGGKLVPFSTRVGVSDAAVFATVTNDPKLYTISITGDAVEEKAIVEKYPSSNSMDVYLYPIKINETVAGKSDENEVLIYARASNMVGNLIPKKGDRLFFILAKGDDTLPSKMEKSIDTSNLPIYLGYPVFYLTDSNLVLSIRSTDDMTIYDMTTRTNFKNKVKEIWNLKHK